MSEAAFWVDLKRPSQIQDELHDDGLVGHLLHQCMFLWIQGQFRKFNSTIYHVIPITCHLCPCPPFSPMSLSCCSPFSLSVLSLSLTKPDGSPQTPHDTLRGLKVMDLSEVLLTCVAKCYLVAGCHVLLR